jgi:hypothetical protein
MFDLHRKWLCSDPRGGKVEPKQARATIAPPPHRPTNQTNKGDCTIHVLSLTVVYHMSDDQEVQHMAEPSNDDGQPKELLERSVSVVAWMGGGHTERRSDESIP